MIASQPPLHQQVSIAARWRCRALVMALALLLVLLAAPAAHAAKGDPEKVEPPKALDDFALKDHRGSDFTQEQLKGKWSLVLLGFTHCPDICPLTLQNLTQVMQQLSMHVRPDRLPQVVFVGVDPARDEPVLADYIKTFGPDFLGVTGKWPEIKTIVEGVEGFVRIDKKTPKSLDYQVYHSAFVAVIDPQGRLVARLSPPMNSVRTATFLSSLMREYAKEIN